ncbi:cation diffusion facilitator family transporter [Arthrobacter oryzae]|uniref:Cobalt-zinc-cadmium efflux system protein n=1 Tax=Arthrobacter oryzae TaxID=409290 RepID=A0A495FN43_9MICC|nr:cation diffusion facilitator family transporter [Arthrobacter oryzae]RKR30157.1 cobalt-zinc-cadmium efflux system protein [Arthrobacter oryzae]
MTAKVANHHAHDAAGKQSPASHDGHGHGIAANADRRYLVIALALIVGFMILEVAVAVVSGSLALLSDAGHMLTDAGAIAASLWAMNLAARPARGIWTFGFKRAEILSAAANGVTLLVISALVAAEAIHRILEPPPVSGGPVLIVAILGVLVNLVAVWVLAKANRASLNVEGSFQHILTDLFGFIATAIAGLVVLTTGFARADAIASLIVVALMLHAAWGLLRDSGRILLEAAPEGVDLDQIREHLLETEHVRDVHDLHVWTVTSDLPALSAHVVLDEECFYDGHAPRILDELQTCLTGHFDVEHSTFQLEPSGHAVHEAGTH